MSASATLSECHLLRFNKYTFLGKLFILIYLILLPPEADQHLGINSQFLLKCLNTQGDKEWVHMMCAYIMYQLPSNIFLG